MGVSTNAILFWGLCFDEDNTYPWNVDADEYDEEEDFDWEDRYAIAVGIDRPTAEYESAKEEYSKYWDKKRKAAKKSGCTVSYHCSDECSMYYVAIADSELTARRGRPQNIDSLEIGADWEEKLTEFCRLMGIKTKQKPRWWLVSYWG